ncbi:unnamed protein product [Closterium sp. NIES-53]
MLATARYPAFSSNISDLPGTDLSGSELGTSEAEKDFSAWNGRTSQPFSPWWRYRLSGSNQASSDWVGDPPSNFLEAVAAATQKSSSGSESDSDSVSDSASDANPNGSHCRSSDLTTTAAKPPSSKVPSQLLGGVNRRWSLGGGTSSGGGGGKGGGMVTDNLDMLCLQSKLSLLESQREQNAVRCQQFVNMLRFAAEQAGEEMIAEDASKGDVVGKKERALLPVHGLALGGRRRLNRRRSTSDLLEARRRACAADLVAGRVDRIGLPGSCAARNRIDRASHEPKGSDNSSVSSEAPERSPEESPDGSDVLTTRGASGGVCSRSWTTGSLSQASLSATLHRHLASNPMEQKLCRGRTHDGRSHVERNHGARIAAPLLAAQAELKPVSGESQLVTSGQFGLKPIAGEFHRITSGQAKFKPVVGKSERTLGQFGLKPFSCQSEPEPVPVKFEFLFVRFQSEPLSDEHGGCGEQ